MGKIALRCLLIIVILSLFLNLYVEGSKKRRRRYQNELKGMTKKWREWVKKRGQPDKFGVVFMDAEYRKRQKKAIGAIKYLIKYRMDKLKRSTKKKHMEATRREVKKKYADLEKATKKCKKRLMPIEYPKKYNELQVKAAGGNKWAAMMMRELKVVLKKNNIPVPTPLPPTTTTTTTPTTTKVSIRRRPNPGKMRFIKLPNGQVVPASNPAAAAMNSVKGRPNSKPRPHLPSHSVKPIAVPHSHPTAAAVNPVKGRPNGKPRPHLPSHPVKPIAVPPSGLAVPVAAAGLGPGAVGGPFANKNSLNTLIHNVEHPAAAGGVKPGGPQKKTGATSINIGGTAVDKRILFGAIGVVVLLVFLALACR